MAGKEKRLCGRHAHQGSLDVCPYGSGAARPAYSGRMGNYSEGGLFFEAELEPRPGSYLILRVRGTACCPLDPESGEGVRTVSVAEVRWCREVGETSGSPRYAVGVKYCRS